MSIPRGAPQMQQYSAKGGSDRSLLCCLLTNHIRLYQEAITAQQAQPALQGALGQELQLSSQLTTSICQVRAATSSK